MDWDDYVDTGMLHAPASFDSCSHGTIKPTYLIDDDAILHTVSPTEQDRLHMTQHIYDGLDDSPVPVPEVRHDGTDRDAPFLVVDAVEGDNPERSYGSMEKDELLSFAYQSGEALGHAHQAYETDSAGTILADGDGLTIDDQSWDRLITDHMREKVEYLRETDLDDAYLDEADAIIDRIGDDLPASTDTGLMHLDYRPGNIMWDGDEITAVLDWDNARSGDQLYDYVNAEVSFVENAPEQLREDVRDAFREGYTSTGRKVSEDDAYDDYRYLSLLSKAKGMLYVNEQYDAGRTERASRYTERFLDEHRAMRE